MNSAVNGTEIIKKLLGDRLRVVETCNIPQHDGIDNKNVIVIERCLIDGCVGVSIIFEADEDGNISSGKEVILNV